MNLPEFTVRFVLAVLATWRVTHLLAAEDGPADLVVRFRALLGQSIFGQLMDCFNCLSIWIAAPAALFVTRGWLNWLMAWLAVSGAACLLERIGQQPALIQPDYQHPQGEPDYVLRTETNGTEEQPVELEQERFSRAAGAANQPDAAADPFDVPESRSPDREGHRIARCTIRTSFNDEIRSDISR
jgi:hypothetical protein